MIILEKAEKAIFNLCKTIAQRDFNLNRVEHFLSKYTEEFSFNATFDFYEKSIEFPDNKTAEECYISMEKIDIDAAVKELSSVKASLEEEHKKLTDTKHRRFYVANLKVLSAINGLQKQLSVVFLRSETAQSNELAEPSIAGDRQRLCDGSVKLERVRELG